MAPRASSPAKVDLGEVGRIFTERMDYLGLTQGELAERSGVSTSTIRKLKYGGQKSYQPPNLTALSKALDWPPDTLARLLRGDFNASDAGELIKRARDIFERLRNEAVHRPPDRIGVLEERMDRVERVVDQLVEYLQPRGEGSS